jgi:hypothetical protein
MEWKLNHEICLEERATEVPHEQERMKMIEFQEVFEHLRLTFSNWLATKDDGGEFRQTLEDVIFARRLPLFEKRKRLEILLGGEVKNWITTDFADEDAAKGVETSLLRVDCRIRTQGACVGRCGWKQEGEGKCLLHVPKETDLGEQEKKVSAPRVLLLRLIEELLRYGERRRQLMDQDVSRLATLERPVTIDGKDGKQRIYPEKSAAWFDLLRLEWATKVDEEPQFYEEMSGEGAAAPPLAEQDEASQLPPSLQLLLNGGPEQDPKTGALRLFRAPFEALMVPFGLAPTQVAIKADTTVLTDETIKLLAGAKLTTIVQINIAVDPPTIIAKKPAKPTMGSVPVFVITVDGPALLLNSTTSIEFLKRDEMPKGLLDIVNKAKSFLAVKKA